MESTPSSSASCFWVRPEPRLAMRSRSPTPPLSWAPKPERSYQTGQPRAAAAADATSATAEPDALSAPLAALIALGEEERPSAPRQPVAEDAAA